MSFGRLVAGLCCAAVCLSAACVPGGEIGPNVLLVVVDDLNTDLGAYGHPVVQTPNIDRLAERGVLFSRAYTQYPQCNQSRASMLTGLYPEQLGVLDLQTHFRDRHPELVTLPQHFRRNGYFTARVGKVFHQGVPTEIGSDGLDDPQSWDVALNPSGIDREVEDRIVSIVPAELDQRKFGANLSWLAVPGDDRQHTDGLVASRAVELLEAHHPGKTGKPIFLAVGFYRPHTPFVAPESYFSMYPADQVALAEERPGDRDNKPVAALADRPHQAEMTELQRRQAIQAYHASISFVDTQLGRVTAALDRLGLADTTLVVFVSDHGYALGQHGLWQKTNLFENTALTPLIIAAPQRFEAGLVSEELVELVDIYPTLVSLSGLGPPGHELQGIDLQAVLADQAPGRLTALTQSWSAAHRTRPERRGMEIMGYSIRTDRYRYTEWAQGDEGVELYDYLEDPGEFQNLARSAEYRDTVKRMQSLLAERLDSSR